MKRTALQLALTFAAFAITALFAFQAVAGSPEQLSTDARAALATLTSSNAAANALSKSARGVLVFPRVIKTGLVARPYREFGGAYGEGALIKSGAKDGYYNIVSSNWPTGDESTLACAVFLMTASAEASLAKGGLTNGADAKVVVVDDALARNLTSAGLSEDAYVFVFNAGGSVAVASLQGSKIAPLHP